MKPNLTPGVSVCIAMWMMALLAPPCLAVAAPDEEFAGPFPSWRDVKRDYGAVGDGKADDTAAIQRGLDDLQKHDKSVVLFVPAGTYRITQTLQTHRAAHTDCMGVRFCGEDPASTKFIWDGPAGGTMIKWDAWYSCIGREIAAMGRRKELVRIDNSYRQASRLFCED
jgi:hypothetical protein